MDLSTATTARGKRSHDCLESPNGDAPVNRRKDPKTSRACDACRAKKIRCSGTLPCSTCFRRKLTCTFVGRYDRGRPPTPQSPTERALGQGKNDIGVAPAVSSLPDASTYSGQYVGMTSNLTFLQRAWSNLSPQSSHLDSVPSDGIDGTERHQPLMSAGDIPLYHNGSADNVLPDDDDARQLLAFYFETCVVTHRILHRQTVEAWLDTILQNRAQGHLLSVSVGNAKLATILAVLAIATFRRHKLQTGSSFSVEKTGLEQSDPLFCGAMQLTDSEQGFPVLESAQARLIQVLYLLQTTRMNKAYYTVGTACQIIFSLGLHRRQSARKPGMLFSVSSDYIALQCSKRVFWTAYILDKYLSVVFGRPKILQDDEIDQEFPDAVNDEDLDHRGPSTVEPQEESHVSSLIVHAKIARIIGQTSAEVYRVGEGQATSRLTTARRLIQELHDWHGSLPVHLGAVKPTTLVASFRREASALRLAYLHALIHATRPFLLRDHSTNSPAPALKEIRSECLVAARKTLELISTMATECNLINSLWWTQYVLFCALAVVYVWEIQQFSTHRTNPSSQAQLSLHDLAERCRGVLLHDSTATPLGHRYGTVLEELRLEAEKRTSRSSISSVRTRPIQQHLDSEGWMNDGDDTITADQQTMSGPGAEPEDLVVYSSMFDDWQPVDWLDLDSSVFYPALGAAGSSQ